MNETANERTVGGRIADYIPLIRATDGLTLSQICLLSKLEPSTIQNWIKRGFVPHPINKKYHERHLARILLIAQLREAMQIDRVGELLGFINGDADDENDDIITEERLYDVFREVTITLDNDYYSPERISELTEQKAKALLFDLSAKERGVIISALKVMAFTYVSGRYKKLADKMFNDLTN